MASSETARLILQVDAAVAIAQSNLRALAATVETESGKYDNSVKKMEGAHARLNNSVGTTRIAMMEMQHTFRAFGDSVAAGQDPVRAFIMELGRVGQAAELLGQGGAMGGFGRFIGGPWGMALSLGIATLASLAGGHKDAAEASKEQETIENLLVRALKGEEEATKKLTAAIEAKTKAARQAIETDRERARGEFHQTQSDLTKATDARPRLTSEKDVASRALADRQKEANAALAAFKNDPASDDAAAAAERAAISLQAAQATAERAAKAWKENETRILSLSKLAATQQVPLLRLESAAHTDEGTAIKRKADAAEHDLRVVRDRELTAAGENTTKQREANQRYVDGMDRVTRQRLKEEKELAERNKERNASTHLRGNDMTTADAIALIRGAGGVVTSGDRSNAKQKQLYDAWVAQGRPADNPVAPPGASAHNGAHGKHALDIAGMSAKEIDEAFTAAGVHLTKILQERGHIHVEWGKGGPSAETMARRADAAARHEANDDRGFEVELQAANQRLARGRAQLADTAEARYAIEIDEIEMARAARDREIEDERKAGKFGDPSSGAARIKELQLQTLNGEQALIEKRIAKERLDAQVIDRQYQHDQTMLTGTLTLLGLQEQLAETGKERRRVAQDILNYEERQARAALQHAIDLENSKPKPDQQRLSDLRGQMAGIGPEYAARRTLADRRNADPLTAYMQQLRANTGDMNEALKGVEVDGLKSLEDGILGVINGTETLAGAFKKMAASIIADLARIAIEKGILSLISMFSGGGGGGFGDLGAFKGAQDSSGLAFAAGGSPPVGLASLVGEKGPELFVPKVPGVIIPNHMLGGKGGGGVAFNIQIDAKGAEIGVEQKIAAALVQVAPQFIAAAHRHTMGSLSRRGING